MKKIFAVLMITAGIFAASFLNVEVKVSVNQAVACNSDDCK